jgi:hypothetical protein
LVSAPRRLQKTKPEQRALHRRRATKRAICVCTRARLRHTMNMQTAAHYCSINLISPRRDALAFNLKHLSPFDRHSLCFRNKPARVRLLFNSAQHIVCKFWQNGARYSKFMHRAQKLNARRGHNTHGPESGGWFSTPRCCGCGADFLFIHHRRHKWFVELK